MTRFNRVCYTIALFWLSITVPAGLIIRPTIPDFSQFYVGGALVRLDKWSGLYPTPWRGSQDNAGLHSNAKSEWVQISMKRGAPNYTHFILPPPSALLFVPLSYLSYVQAFWVWTFLLSASIMVMALLSADLLREVFGKPTRWEGVLVLLIVMSPMTARSIRISNVTPFIALSIALILRSLFQEKSLQGGTALVIGVLLKYATLILAPLLIVTRKWRILVCAIALIEAVAGITLLLAGEKPFFEFFRVILPTLSRPSAYLGNQSLPGMLARSFGRPLSPFALEALVNLRVASATAVGFALIRLRSLKNQTPKNILAGAALLMSWLLVFSPVAWEHWAVMLCPIWGWLIWEAVHEAGWKRGCAIASLALMYFPAGILQVPGFASYPIEIPEPFNSTQLLGFMLLFGLSFSRLYLSSPVSQPIPATVLNPEENFQERTARAS